MIIKWDITKSCFLKCKFCLNQNSREHWQKDCTTEEVKKILDKLFQIKELESLTFLGGEPTFRQDFLEITDYIQQHSNLPFTVVSNGLKFVRSEYERLLSNRNLRIITISIDGPEEDDVDQIRGKNVYKNLIRALQKIAHYRKVNSLRYELHLNTVLTRKNFRNIEKMVQFALQYSANSLSFLGYVHEDQGEINSGDLAMNIQDEIEALHTVAQLFTNHQSVWKQRNFTIDPNFASTLAGEYITTKYPNLKFPPCGRPCGIGIQMVYINNHGEFFPCDRMTPFFQLSKKLGLEIKRPSLLTEDFYEIYNSSTFKKTIAYIQDRETFKQYHPCNKCKYLLRTCFPCGVYSIDQEKHYEFEECTFYYHELCKMGKDMSIPTMHIPEDAFHRAIQNIPLRVVEAKEKFAIDPSIRVIKTKEYISVTSPKTHSLLYLNPTAHLIISVMGKNIQTLEEVSMFIMNYYQLPMEKYDQVKNDLSMLLAFWESKRIIQKVS